MFSLSEKVGVTLSSNGAWWSWALMHACWILNRFGSTKAVTPYELAFGREYAGALREFGEPVFLVIIDKWQNPQQGGRDRFSWARWTPKIHTCCTMDSHWSLQEASDASQLPGKDTLRFM